MVEDRGDPLQRLVGHLSRLPGIGERTALRLVQHLLREDRDLMRALGHALMDAAEGVQECSRCCAPTLSVAAKECAVCDDPRRDHTLLCVVAHEQDRAALENTGEFRGLYHVLHGTLAPLAGVGPSELRIVPLLKRLSGTDHTVREVILATPPTVDGEATALYLSRQLTPAGLVVSRIASGVPVGGELSHADRPTLARSLAARIPAEPPRIL